MDYKGVSKILDKYGSQITEAIARKMKQDGTVASGKTIQSIGHDVKGLELDIYGSGVVQSISDGLKPKRYRKGRGDFIKNIISWMKSKGIQPRTLRTGRFVPRTETNYKRNAFVLARAIADKGTIKRFGYRGTGVLEYAFGQKVQNKFMDEVGDEISRELMDEITLKFKNNGFTEQ